MKVGIDCRFYSSKPTGIGRYIYDLCSNLLDYKDLELVLFINNDSPFLSEKKFDKCEKIIIKEKIFSILGLITLGKKIDDADIDLFHATSFMIPFIKEKKYLTTIYDLIHINTDEYGILYKIYYEIFVKRNLLKSDEIITISKNSKKDIENWIKRKDIHNIYLGVDKKFTQGVGISDFFYKNELDINNYILYVGNNRKTKNLRRLLEAYFFARLEVENIPPLVLTCESDTYIDAYIQDHGLSENIKFVGNISDNDLIFLYYYSTFFIFPSLYEGFGLPVLEAMSCGSPVATSMVSSIPEIGGTSVMYFDPYNIKSIKDVIVEMVLSSELREKFSLKGLEQAKKFNLSEMANQTYKVYEKVFNK
ncbi:MAG: glycosyltransferase family 1 protein [Candidatus Sericytochromatia bacterium]